MPPTKKYSPMIKPILTEDQVREIRKIYKMADKVAKRNGKKQARAGLVDDLAAKYGVTRRAIQHVRTGDRWKDLR